MAELVDDLRPDNGFNQAYARALRLLGQREHARRELQRKLVRKSITVDVASAVVDKLCSEGLQSDERYATGLIRRRIDRGYGPIYIRAELRQHDIDDELIDAELTRTGEFWLDEARRVLARKFGDQVDARDAQARFLARRGFPADLIYRALDRNSDIS